MASGEFEERTLKDVLEEHLEYLECNSELSILIKFINAKKDLSIQVHPDDEYAREHESGQRCGISLMLRRTLVLFMT